MRFYGEISRVDAPQRMVWGYASTPNKASDGKTITLDAMRAAFDDYMAFANIREMHQPSAVGRAEEGESYVDDGGIYIGAKVVDAAAWEKVTEKVYRGFSIGAKITARDPSDPNTVTGIKLYEISLVDRPADEGARFDVWRAETINDEDEMATEPTIKTRADLESVLRSITGTKPAASLKKTLLERAAALDALGLIPDAWKDATPAATQEPAPDVARAEGDGGVPAADAPVTEEAPAAPATEETPAADPAPEPDPVARATQAAEKALAGATGAIERAEAAAHPETTEGDTIARAELPGAELRRGISAVSRLGYLLSELAYIALDAQYEADYEGDNSPVPAKLRTALADLAKAYRAMSDEELAELLKSVGVEDVIQNGVMILAASGAGLERLNDAHADILKRAGHEVVIAEAPAQGDEIARLSAALETANTERDTLLRTVDTITTQVATLTQRIDKLGQEPAPAKAAANNMARAVDKETDATGKPGDAAPQVTPDMARQYLDSLPEAERALILIRAAHTQPVAITHR